MASLTHGREFEQALGDSEGQGSLVCCSPWGRKELGMTEQLSNNKNQRITKSSLHLREMMMRILNWRQQLGDVYYTSRGEGQRLC